MRLEEVVAGVLKRPSEDMNENTSPKTVSSWDSLRHIELVMTVEQEFGVSFPPAEVATMTSLGAIRQLLLQKGIET